MLFPANLFASTKDELAVTKILTMSKISKLKLET